MPYVYTLALVMMQFKQTATNVECLLGWASHDQLTRALNLHDVGKKLLDLITIPGQFRGGYLVLDDTVIEKPYAQAFEAASYVYSSSKGKAVYGYNLVLLIWTDGVRRIVVDYKIYRKGGPSKLDLELNMLSYARNRLVIKPKFVLFDSWYGAKKLLKRLSDYGWKFITRLKKNRRLNGIGLNKFRKLPRWTESGTLEGGVKVLVVKDDNKYFASNCLSLRRTELLELYSQRQHIEQVNKELKFFGLENCQMRSIKAQTNHTVLCIAAYQAVHRRSVQLGISTVKCRKLIVCGKEHLCKSDVARIKSAA